MRVIGVLTVLIVLIVLIELLVIERSRLGVARHTQAIIQQVTETPLVD